MKNDNFLAKEKNILVVDDTPDNVRLLSSILTKAGYQVRKALNGQRALTTIEAAIPDLILLDVMMPEMDGYEVCQKLKENEATSQVPVIFISALDDGSAKVKAFEMGGVDYVSKPFQREEVLARVENHLTIHNQQEQLEAQNELLQEEIRQRQKTEVALKIAREKSEKLLLNILPRKIVDGLQQFEGSIAEKFDEVTILFADIVGFTAMAGRVSALEVVQLLNGVFSAFDKLTEKHDLEKIKTIGDAYMVAAGLPEFRSDHAEAIALMALDMQAAITDFKNDLDEPLVIRMGINSGPVVAGVIGSKKFSYDLWGNTVNIAFRMQSEGKPGKIQVSAESYELLKDRYVLEKRGAINVKGKGEMVTYWLTGKQG